MKTNENFKNKNYLIITKLSNNFKKIISRRKIKKYNLDNGNNGIGDRFMNGKYNYSVIYQNGSSKNYSENENDKINDKKLDKFLKKKNHQKNKGIIGIYIHSLRKNILSRPIRKDIRLFYKDCKCVHCGSGSNIIIDHKNDLYNDKRVLKSYSQVKEDFQPLCNHCNLLKRQICKEEKKNCKIFSARKLDRFRYINFLIPWELKNYDVKDINTKKDTYFYDPIEFEDKLYRYIIYVKPLLNEIKKLTVIY